MSVQTQTPTPPSQPLNTNQTKNQKPKTKHEITL